MSTILTSGTKLPTGPVEVFSRSCVPSWIASICSRSPPSAELAKCWHLKRFWVFFSTSSQNTVEPTP
ncbi:hypothetical protein D9M68_754370 [compost metagenome]